MRLLTKTSLLYLVFAVPAIAACAFICFYLIHAEVIKNTDERLMKDFSVLKGPVKELYVSTEMAYIPGECIVRPSGEKYTDTVYSFSDTVMFDPYEDEMLPFRVLKVQYPTPLQSYDVILRKSYLESEDLIDGIITALSLMLGFLLAGFFAINYFVSKNLWKPFRQTLGKLESYDIHSDVQPTFDPVSTQEFGQLNRALNGMTRKIRSDYENLKEFTENASHELQTPLAIIRSKLELLMQQENISPEQTGPLQDVYESANRLAKLNQSLLLLARIENRQFHELQPGNLKELIGKKLDQLEDLIAFKNLKVEKYGWDTGPSPAMNPHLADILLSNILGNAIRHNISGGNIRIALTASSLTVSNSGPPLSEPGDKMFERFRKGSTSSESSGLGLAIVKKICEVYHLKVDYTCVDEIHTISIEF